MRPSWKVVIPSTPSVRGTQTRYKDLDERSFYELGKFEEPEKQWKE